MKRLIVLITSLILLTGCDSSQLINSLYPKPRVVTQFSVQKVDIPKILLTPATPPDALLLKDVKICKGAKELTKYGKDLLYCNYLNTEKLRAVKELLK